MHKLLFTAGLAFAVVSLQAQTSQSNSSNQNTQNSNTYTQNQQYKANQETQNQVSQGTQAESNPATNQTSQSATNQNAQTANQGNQTASTRQNMRSRQAMESHDVNRMLKDTNEARQAIKNSNEQQAMTYVNQALHASNRLDKADNGNPMVPLFTELDEYSVLAPVRQAQASRSEGNQTNTNQSTEANEPAVQAANNHANQYAQSGNGNGEQANNNWGRNNRAATTGNYQNDIAVRRASGQFTMVAIDAKIDRDHLEAAKQALQRGDMKAADAALAAVQNGVVVESAKADRPLLRARENLILARDAAHDGNFQEAKAALEGASSALARFEQQGGQNASSAKQLQAQISSYDQNVHQNRANMDAKIDSWWSELAQWSTPTHSINSNNTVSQNRNNSNSQNTLNR